MKQIKRFLLSLLMVGVLFFSTVSQVAAAAPYTYTVRIYAGNQGKIGTGNGKVVEYTGLKYGERFSFRQSAVKLQNSNKYYIKGLKISGRDNSTSVSNPSFIVTGDVDYIVTYGMLGDAVAYTIRYVDEEGNELAPSETYYGNIGDKPVIAFLYIEGYMPNAFNITGVLKEDPASNVFTFVYSPITTEVIEENVGVEDGDSAQGDGSESEDMENSEEDENGEGLEDTEGSDDAESPDELLDIDDDDVPLWERLFDTIAEIVEQVAALPAGAKAVGTGGLVALLGLLILLLFVHKKNKKNKKNKADEAEEKKES